MTLDDTQYNSRYGAMKKITVLLHAIDSLDTITNSATATVDPNLIDTDR